MAKAKGGRRGSGGERPAVGAGGRRGAAAGSGTPEGAGAGRGAAVGAGTSKGSDAAGGMRATHLRVSGYTPASDEVVFTIMRQLLRHSLYIDAVRPEGIFVCRDDGKDLGDPQGRERATSQVRSILESLGETKAVIEPARWTPPTFTIL